MFASSSTLFGKALEISTPVCRQVQHHVTGAPSIVDRWRFGANERPSGGDGLGPINVKGLPPPPVIARACGRVRRLRPCYYYTSVVYKCEFKCRFSSLLAVPILLHPRARPRRFQSIVRHSACPIRVRISFPLHWPQAADLFGQNLNLIGDAVLLILRLCNCARWGSLRRPLF